MHIAAANGYMEVLAFLIENGASMDEKDKDGWTPFHAAVCWQQVSHTPTALSDQSTAVSFT